MVLKLAFGYKMGVGKDTAVEYCISKYNGKQVSFASSIYKIMYELQTELGIKRQKDREFLQFIGSWARKYNENIWVEKALISTSNTENLFLSDLRYKNEFNALKQNGWICVKIIRTNVSENRTGTGSSNHTSELELDQIPDSQWDFIIINNGSLENFYNELDRIINSQ